MEETIIWKQYSLERPKDSGAYLHCVDGQVEVHWYDPKDASWCYGMSGDMDYAISPPEIWAEMPKGTAQQSVRTDAKKWCECEHASTLNGVCVVCALPRR